MAGSAFKDPGVVQRVARFTPILVNGDDHVDLLGKWGSRGDPTVVFCDAEGEKRHMVVGSLAPAAFRAEVDRAIAAVFDD